MSAKIVWKILSGEKCLRILSGKYYPAKNVCENFLENFVRRKNLAKLVRVPKNPNNQLGCTKKGLIDIASKKYFNNGKYCTS